MSTRHFSGRRHFSSKVGIGLIAATLGLIAAVLCLRAPGNALARQSALGKVDFPTSGSPDANRAFLRGVAALHSFWFEEALDAFRDSTKIEPDFMMGYWGEAMAHNHPLWAQQDTEAARKVLEKIHDSSKLSPRERAYLAAVKVLYGEGDKLTRDNAYSMAMEKIYHDYPDDLEAASFYALSLLGTVRPGDKGFRRQMLAGAIALDVYRKNPDHPGAAHYIIHSFDDPEHAILALPAARRYAEIAPDAHHARHMPSHIFLQLGMWPEAAASNESAWRVSDAWVKRKDLPISQRDYHSLHWLTYVYLQQGKYKKADDQLGLVRWAFETGKAPALKSNYENMAGECVVETEQWAKAAELFDTKMWKAPPPAYGETAEKHDGMGHYQGGDQVANYITGLALAMLGKPEAEAKVSALEAIQTRLSGAGEAYRAKQVQIMQIEIQAAQAAVKGEYDKAIEMMRRATALEEELSPPSGPPDLIKPPHELFGEILLRAGRAKEAQAEFGASLLREPNRVRSLLGSARAAAKAGDSQAAAAAYGTFLKYWNQADAGLPETREARSYMEQASAR
jgi:tetratricopeptide (TPR) repeat protein